MELTLALVCDDARETPDGKLDVHGVFNDLFAPGFPAKQERMTLVLVVEWDREDHGRFQFAVDLVDPAGQPSLSITGHSDVDAREEGRPPARTRLILPLEGVIFPQPGAYRVMVRLKGRELAGPAIHLARGEAPREAVGGGSEG